MKKKSAALLCALTFLFSGCSLTADTPPSNPNDALNSSEQTDSIQNTENTLPQMQDNEDVTVSFDNISNTYQNDDEQTDLLYSNYTRPLISIRDNAGASTAIMDEFSNREKLFIDTSKDYTKEAKSSYEQDADIFSPFYLSESYDTKRCDNRILSFQCRNDCFLGGTHENYFYNGLNFDVTTGKLLRLDDISTDKETLLENAKDYILSQLELPRYQNLTCSGDELQNVIHSDILTDETWYFTNSGITFVSNIDILGPYAAGAYFFTIPYQQLSDLKPEYQYTGPFEMTAPIGTALTANLDGNEDIDAVFFDCSFDDHSGYVSVSFTINGTDFSSYLQSEDCFLSEGAAYSAEAEYYIMDLDTSDDFLEIAITDYGANDYQVTYFFRYNGGKLTLLGNVPACISNPKLRINGDGTINTYIAVNLLETVKAAATFQMERDGTLTLVPQDWFYIDESDLSEKYKTHRILRNVTVYTEKDRDSDTVTLTPSDGEVCFPATDNEHWFMLETADKQIYYLYLEDFFTLESGENASEIFENLLIAG